MAPPSPLASGGFSSLSLSSSNPSRLRQIQRLKSSHTLSVVAFAKEPLGSFIFMPTVLGSIQKPEFYLF
jgi:hypothetical protein